MHSHFGQPSELWTTMEFIHIYFMMNVFLLFNKAKATTIVYRFNVFLCVFVFPPFSINTIFGTN